MKHNTLQSVQAMRGVAAIAVALFHTHSILSQPEYGEITVLGSVAAKGWLGVNFFFVVSGFIIFHAHARDIGLPNSLPRYCFRRLTRVYPIYWLLLTCYILAAACGIGHPDFKWDVGDLLSAYMLLNLVDMPTLPLKVAWTLLFEIKFYVMFAALIVSRRVGTFVMAAWAAAIVIRSSFSPYSDWGYLAPDWGMLNILNMNFLFGMFACWSIRITASRYGTWLLGAGVLLLVLSTYGAIDMDSTVKPGFVLPVACSFSLIVLGAASCEQAYSWKIPTLPILLGEASYSIYLVHSAALSLMAGINLKLFHGNSPPVVVFVLCFGVAVTAGVTVHLLVEKPILKRLRQAAERTDIPDAEAHPVLTR